MKATIKEIKSFIKEEFDDTWLKHHSHVSEILKALKKNGIKSAIATTQYGKDAVIKCDDKPSKNERSNKLTLIHVDSALYSLGYDEIDEFVYVNESRRITVDIGESDYDEELFVRPISLLLYWNARSARSRV